MTGRYEQPRPITPTDDIAEFECGEPSLDDWLRQRAVTNHAAGTSRTFITTGAGRVVGFYALATGAVERATAPRRVQHGQPEAATAILPGRLAVDRKEQGKGLGSHLFRDAIIRSVKVAETVGVRALLVHALDESARAFYPNFDFEPSPTDELHLFLLMKDARTLLR